jgi:hypothetical protein
LNPCSADNGWGMRNIENFAATIFHPDGALKVIMSVFEESAFYEIVEMEDGDIALLKSNSKDEEPLVKIRFSPESNEYLGAARFEVARVMIEAGLDAVADLEEQTEADTSVITSNLLH